MYTNNRKTNGTTKTIWIKAWEPLGVDLNYSLILKNNSFCLGVQGLLILAIHAMFFSFLFVRGEKQTFGRIILSLSAGDGIKLDPDGTGSKHKFRS